MQPVIRHRTVWCLGFSQLISWGISYYLIGCFGNLIAADTGWRQSVVYGGYSAALFVMGLASPVAGRLIDRYGGRWIMSVGSVLNALGCIGLALSTGLVSYYAAWVCLGIAMRLTLYDAAFAALAHLGGPLAKTPISRITLLGGLASSVFWPVGQALAERFGWRGALFGYAGFALLTVPLNLAIPSGSYQKQDANPEPETAQTVQSPHDHLFACGLFALIFTMTNFLNAGMSAHMIPILTGLGVTAAAAVQIGALRGISQSSARVLEIFFGKRVQPLSLNVGATFILPLGFAFGLLSGQFAAAAVVFSLLYGAGNGLATITRGTVPLVLFGHRAYGKIVGMLLAPSFLLSAAAPLIFSFVIERLGHSGALVVSTAIAAASFAAALTLKLRFSRRITPAQTE